MPPLFSIIIPTYNRADFLGETLEAVISQNYGDWECIVVDDGSTDRTIELMEFYIKEDDRIKFVSRPNYLRKGQNSCRNFGFSVSKGRFIKWFDSDDLIEPNALELHLPLCNDESDVIVSSLHYINANKTVIPKEHYYHSENIINDYLVGKITFYISTPTWNRTFLCNQPKLFDERISNLDDWDFNLRMLYKEPKIKYINEPLILYRVHENSLSKEIARLDIKELKSEIAARKKHFIHNLLNRFSVTREYRHFLIDQNKRLLKIAIAEGNNCRFFLLMNLLFTLLLSGYFGGFLKSLTGGFINLATGRGYSFFK